MANRAHEGWPDMGTEGWMIEGIPTGVEGWGGNSIEGWGGLE